ncbi:unnamed protein product [Paramecium primaurelia]|uniref:Uncharacterized protein n=1 Tax=Paramecium primaurelia TaxID=5886 RepID=A0A8S1JLI1_PARPR|nr:unnamed protein product [Paramecium primaurelia]
MYSDNNNAHSEIRIRQLLYFKQPPQTTLPTNRSTMKLQTLEHKLGRTNKNFTGYSKSQSDTRPFFENFMEKTDQITSFGFKYPFNVEDFQNTNAQIHFLEVFTHSQQLIQNYISDSKRTLAQLKEQSKQIKDEMEQMKEKTEKKIEQLEDQFNEAVQVKQRQLKEDYVAYSTESYRLNKEISKLTKDKLHMEEQSIQLLQKIIKLEKQMQGVEMDLMCENEQELQSQLRGTFHNTKSITH